MSIPPTQPCPCGRTGSRNRPLLFQSCCGRWTLSGTPAPDAESLMRSRYTSYVLNNEPYLLATWHASTRPAEVTSEPNTKWLGLDVLNARQFDDTHAEVEFVARYRVGGGKAVRMQERSRFVREEGRWYYIDGNIDGEPTRTYRTN